MEVLDQPKTFELTDTESKFIRRITIGRFGATIHQIIVSDGTSERNIVLGYDTPEEYEPPLRPAKQPYHGSTVGRYAGRIANAKFHLNGEDYNLVVNNGPNALHGGPTGFSERQWTLEELGTNKVTLSYES